MGWKFSGLTPPGYPRFQRAGFLKLHAGGLADAHGPARCKRAYPGCQKKTFCLWHRNLRNARIAPAHKETNKKRFEPGQSLSVFRMLTDLVGAVIY